MSGDIELNAGRERRTLEVTSTSVRVVRVSSHYPFWRVNPRLAFDREAARGFRLDIPAGTSVAWQPGETRRITLVALAAPARASAPPPPIPTGGRHATAARLSHDEYATRYGPTAGDLVRLGDTSLRVRIEHDDTAYGEEPMWGFAKNWRSRQAQRDAVAGDSELDLVIAGVLVIDPILGVRKTNVGVKDGRIVGIGQAGNPEVTDGVALEIGPHTVPLNAYGLIATAGAVDSHVHAITPQVVPPALSGGVTTLITAGFEEPPRFMELVYRAFEALPVNLGLQASARSEEAGPVEALIAAGSCGLKIHEDWGAYPEIIDATLRLADAHDIAVCLHTDALNESAELEDTVAAIAGRTVHAYHVEGSGGGHFPDVIGLVREPSIICSSTTPSIPYGPGTGAEFLDMKLLVHGGNAAVAEDVEVALTGRHAGSTAAEGPLHELGGIAIINSDSQGMGRIGETVRRAFQLAHVMKAWAADDGARDDNDRVRRYLAKVTIEPALTHGIAADVGSLQPGRLADIVLWKPSHFGVKPFMVLKGGYPAWGPAGQGNASVEFAEPTRYRALWGGTGRAPAHLSTTFTSGAALAAGLPRQLASERRWVAVRGTRGLTRASLALNRTAVPIEVDPRDATVTLDGRVLAVDPVREVPLNRRYLLG
jgi:urease subunit alpha